MALAAAYPSSLRWSTCISGRAWWARSKLASAEPGSQRGSVGLNAATKCCDRLIASCDRGLSTSWSVILSGCPSSPTTGWSSPMSLGTWDCFDRWLHLCHILVWPSSYTGYYRTCLHEKSQTVFSSSQQVCAVAKLSCIQCSHFSYLERNCWRWKNPYWLSQSQRSSSDRAAPKVSLQPPLTNRHVVLFVGLLSEHRWTTSSVVDLFGNFFGCMSNFESVLALFVAVPSKLRTLE